MADSNKLELVVEVDVNKANASIKSINSGLSSMEDAARRAGSGAASGIDGFTVSMVKGVAAGELFVEAIKKVIEFTKEWTLDAARSAAELERQVAVTNAAGKAFGITNERAQEAVETFKAVGYTASESEGVIRKLIVSQLGLAKTEGLAKLAKDAAAFSTTGVKAADAAEMLLRAVETGQSRGLRELNIYVDLNEATEHAVLLAQLRGKTLDENQIKQVRWNAVVEAAVGLQGAAASQSDSLAAAEKALGREIEELKEEIGKPFVQWLKDVVHNLGEGVKWLIKHKDAVILFAEGVGVAAGLLATYKIAEMIAGITLSVEALTAALALNPWALLITGIVAGGAIIYKTWKDTQEQLDRGYEDLRRKGFQKQMFEGKLTPDDVKRMGNYSDNDIKEIISGKRLLPGETWGDFSDLGLPKLVKGKNGIYTWQSPDEKKKAKEPTNEELKRQLEDRKQILEAQRTAGDYLLRSLEEQANVEREATKARLEDSMKIIAATNDEAQALNETTRAKKLADEERLAGEKKIYAEEVRETARLSTRVDAATGQIRKVTLNDNTLTKIHEGTAAKIRAFDAKWNEDEARRMDALFSAAMARSQRRFEEGLYVREQQAQWQGNAVAPERDGAIIAAIEERKRAGLAALEGATPKTDAQKLQVENAKTAIEKDAIAERTRLEQQEQQMREAAEDRTINIRLAGVEQRKNLELAQLEQVDAITLQDKVRVEQMKTELEVRAIKERAKIEMEQIDLQTERQVIAAQRSAMAQGIFYQPYLDQLATKIRDLGKLEKDALQQATTSEVDVAQAKGAAETRRIVVDHYRSIFDSLKQQAGGVFDALVTKSQSVWSAIGNSLKTALLTAIKDVVTSRIAAMLMYMFTGQRVTFAGGGAGTGGSGGILGGLLGVGTVPVFGGGGSGGWGPGWTGPNQTPPGAMSFSGGAASAGGLVLAGIGAGGVPVFAPASGSGTSGAGGTVGGSGTTTGGLFNWGGMAAGWKDALTRLGNIGFKPERWRVDELGNMTKISDARGIGGMKGGALLAAGAMLALDGLRRGGWVGVGETTAGGAMIGAKFGGPLGAAIGAGIGFMAGVVRLFVKGAAEKAHDKIKALYGVDISDKGVLQQVVDTAKSAFGGNLDMAIRSPQIRDLIQLYAMTTGQNPKGMPQSVTPLSLVESGGGFYQATQYSNGQPLAGLAGLPSLDQVAGGTMTNAGGTVVIPLQIDSQAVGSVVIQNGRVVTQGAITAMKSNSGRREMTALQLSPGTLVS
jgi:hypothetical protein